MTCMIDTLISLKIVLILLLGTLALDEMYIGLQTTETVNFFSSRAALVQKNPSSVDDFFNNHILKTFVFTKRNPFFSIENLATNQNETNTELTTTFVLRSPLNLLIHASDNPELLQYRTKIDVIEHP